MKKLVADRNVHHLNQAQGSLFTVELLRTLLRNDSDTPFAEALLKGEINLKNIPRPRIKVT